MKTLPRLTVALACVALASCGFFAVETSPRKLPSKGRSAQASQADELFWATLHAGDYGGITQALEASTAAYLKDPGDAISAAHVGWLHVWALTERSRLGVPPPSITDQAALARRYFQEAVALAPTEARYLGFLASTQLAEGAIHQDEKLTRQGYYQLLDAITAWPEFNLFTAGYVMSSQPAGSPRFKQGLDWLWQNLEVCVGAPVDRQQPDMTAYMRLATTQGSKRVCWNSWIAPHNFEGFFLNLGDMLVKAGDWQTARKAYANARLSPDFASWPFAPVLQAHLDAAQHNVALFAKPPDPGAGADAVMMSRSDFACVACHQR